MRKKHQPWTLKSKEKVYTTNKEKEKLIILQEEIKTVRITIIQATI